MKFSAVTLETIVRTDERYTGVLGGALRDAVVAAALELWPDMPPIIRARIGGPGLRPKTLPQSETRHYPVWRRDRGQGLAEYALILALVAVIAIVALLFLGNVVSTILSELGASI